MRTKLEINLDSTALSTSHCILNLFRTVVGTINPETGQSEGGYKEKQMGIAMVYGIAYHKFMDVMFKSDKIGGMPNFPAAKAAALEIYNRLPKKHDEKKPYLSDPVHLINVCYLAWTDYVEEEKNFEIIELNGKPATEITFSVLFYEDDFIKVNLCGTIDKLGKFKGGCYAIGDWKTTGSWNTDEYLKYYEMTKQLRVYRLALTLMAEEHPDSVLGQIGATRVGAFIDAIFLKPKANDISYGRSDVFIYSDEEMRDFRKMLTEECQRFSSHIQSGSFPKQGIVHDTCRTLYGFCKFWNVCKNNEQVGNILLARDFEQVKFNPLAYNDI